MLKEYVRNGSLNTLFFGISNILAKGLWLICMPYIFSKLSVSDIGTFDVYQSFFLIGSLIITSLCAQPLGRYYLKYRNDPVRQQHVLGTSVTIMLCGALICLAACACMLVQYTWYGSGYFAMFLLFNAALYACFSFVTFFLQLKEQRIRYMALYVAQNVVALGIALLSIRAGCGVSSLFWANGISYLLCIPLCISLFYQAGSFNMVAAREQLTYGAPLALYNILYMLLFAVDRWYLAAHFGYTVVGLYAVLWYFGRIYVYATMALHDASPMLIFNAQHEENGTHIIARSVRYVTIVYVTGALFLVPCAYIVLLTALNAYRDLAQYLPLFIMPLLFVETGRFWQAGFNLALKTQYIPLISLVALGVQCVGLYFLGSLGIVGIMLTNTLAYGTYLIMNGIGSGYVYSKHLFEVRPLATLFGLYSLFNLFFWHALATTCPLIWMTVGVALWAPALWFGGVILQDEKLHLF